MKKLTIKHFIPGIIWFFIVLTGICIPRNDIPKVSSWIDLLLDFDKMIHGSMFGLLAFLFMYPFVKTDKSIDKKKRIILWIAIATSCWGYITECIQCYVPGRSYDLVDWTADNMGIIIAFYFTRLFIKKLDVKH